jgi:hypothetical protein
MTRRAVRLALFLMLVAALTSAAWFLFDADRRMGQDRAALQGFEALARRAQSKVDDVRGGVQAYVAPGQGQEFWRRRVAGDIARLGEELAELKRRAREGTAAQEIEAATAAVSAFAETNDRANRMVRYGQLTDASQLIFGDGLQPLAEANEHLEAASQAERTAVDQRQTAARQQSLLLAGLAAGIATIVGLLLLPTGQQKAAVTTAPDVLPAEHPAPSEAQLPAVPVEPAQPQDSAGAPVTSMAPDTAALTGDPPRDRRKATELKATADLCTDFARLLDSQELPGLLERAARLIDATGFIVWVAANDNTSLRPALAHGYTPQALSRLPAIAREADNATAAAWRDAEMRVVRTNGMSPGALVLPLLTPSGCMGVLAAELRHGREASESVRALARIVAAQLSTLLSVPAAGEAGAEQPASHQAHG